jgi:hypothetical protein
MRGKIVELMVRIRNLNELLTHSIRIGETDISRKVRESIKDRERELKILRVQNELNESEFNRI